MYWGPSGLTGMASRKEARDGRKERGGKGRKEGKEGRGNDTQGKEENGMKGTKCKLRNGHEE